MIDRFGLSRIGRMVLKKPVDAIWHVSVVVYDREYNFADAVAYMELGDTDIQTETMHGFAPSHIYEVRANITPPATTLTLASKDTCVSGQEPTGGLRQPR